MRDRKIKKVIKKKTNGLYNILKTKTISISVLNNFINLLVKLLKKYYNYNENRSRKRIKKELKKYFLKHPDKLVITYYEWRKLCSK